MVAKRSYGGRYSNTTNMTDGASHCGLLKVSSPLAVHYTALLQDSFRLTSVNRTMDETPGLGAPWPRVCGFHAWATTTKSAVYLRRGVIVCATTTGGVSALCTTSRRLALSDSVGAQWCSQWAKNTLSSLWDDAPTVDTLCGCGVLLCVNLCELDNVFFTVIGRYNWHSTLQSLGW